MHTHLLSLPLNACRAAQMMRSGCSFKTATLISPAEGGSLSTGYYSSPKLVGLHIFQCTTSELESPTEMRDVLSPEQGKDWAWKVDFYQG